MNKDEIIQCWLKGGRTPRCRAVAMRIDFGSGKERGRIQWFCSRSDGHDGQHDAPAITDNGDGAYNMFTWPSPPLTWDDLTQESE